MTRNIHYGTPEWLYRLLIVEYQITLTPAPPLAMPCASGFGGRRKMDFPRVGSMNDRSGIHPSMTWRRGCSKAYNEAKDHGVTSVGLVPFRQDQFWFQLALKSAATAADPRRLSLLRGL